MKLCTKCNRVLMDSDTYCPHCAGLGDAKGIQPYSESALGVEREAISVIDIKPEVPAAVSEMNPEKLAEIVRDKKSENTALKAEEKTAPGITSAFTIEIPLGKINEFIDDEQEQPNEAKASFSELAVTYSKEDFSIDENLEPQGVTVEFSFKAEKPEKEKEPDDEKTGMIERELKVDVHDIQEKQKTGVSKLGISLVAVLVIMVTVFTVLVIGKLKQAPVEVDEEYYLKKLVGTWISEKFVFVDDAETKIYYVELLEIKEDGTFTLQYLVVNDSIPDGYLEGDWEISEEFSGTVKIFTDMRTLGLIYKQDGQDFVFAREFIELERDKMILREYFDEEKTENFDLEFKKIS